MPSVARSCAFRRRRHLLLQLVVLVKKVKVTFTTPIRSQGPQFKR